VALTDQPLRVDFYILAATDNSARLRFACRLTEKAYGLKHQIHAYTSSAAIARELDELLWTFRQGSFLPHELLQTGTRDSVAPVTIGHDDQSDGGGDFLINLAEEIPPFFDKFSRVAEIVDATADCRRAGRERFSFYKDNGFTPNTHNIS
jgi:DNA polymerase-3 subunit chi